MIEELKTIKNYKTHVLEKVIEAKKLNKNYKQGVRKKGLRVQEEYQKDHES